MSKAITGTLIFTLILGSLVLVSLYILTSPEPQLIIKAANTNLSASVPKVLTKEEKTVPEIERMVDTRDPNTIAGSAWTSNLDCTYKNPPKERTVTMLPFSCEANTHNLRIIESGEDYFTPRSTADDNPPFCLVKVKGNPDPNTISMIKDRQYAYCTEDFSNKY
jgi:hypothetical protein